MTASNRDRSGKPGRNRLSMCAHDHVYPRSLDTAAGFELTSVTRETKASRNNADHFMWDITYN